MKQLFFLFIPFICFSQVDSFKKLDKLPKAEFETAVADSIVKLESLDLWNFLKVLENDYEKDLSPFTKNFIQKMKDTKWPMDMHFLLHFLLEQKTDQMVIEAILNTKKEVWDTGSWSGKFWQVIRENKLNVTEGPCYSVNEKGEKTYAVKALLDEKLKRGEIGRNPILFLDEKITAYKDNELLDLLEQLNITAITFVSKEKSVELFGSRGVDGMISVLTN